MRSTALLRLIAGPVGSGKTTACIFELFRKACEQAPDPVDGMRRTRFAIVRQTLKQLKDTVLKDIMFWFREVADYRVSESTIYIRIGDVDTEWILLPMENPDDARRLLSSQLTGAWMSECIEMSADVISGIFGRCGRYPVPVCTWRGIVMDTNFPTEHSDWWDIMERPPAKMEVFKQPGGMHPEAENLQWLRQTEESLKLPEDDVKRLALGRTYYTDLMESGRNQDWLNRYVHAIYGNDPSGTAVFAQSFNKALHVVPKIEVQSGRLIIVGQDFGRDPWSIIMQMDHLGNVNILEEVSALDIGLEQHIAQSLRPAIYSARYAGCPVAVVGDPAGVAKNNLYELTSFDMLTNMGFAAFAAPTNDIAPRLGAVEHFLLSAKFRVDASRCPMLIRGLAGEYKFERTKDGVRKPTPSKKGDASHPQDALQYGCLAYHGGLHGFISGKLMSKRSHPRRERISPKAWT
ncbi:terminase [Methylocystis heyeri]|uniref:Terminase n=1 Tax=Methylocystis heyeri TaxID=391905 RepID=A0A6B8KEJ3_9HYPH|nr:terminase [Methylocystis heyeri]QGM46107.1 terminase [Methylocystis heyeri]